MSRRRVALLAAVVFAAVPACREANRLIDVTGLSVAPDSTSVVLGSSRHLTAIGIDRAGMPFIGVPATWMSSNDAVATVSDRGLVTGVSLGMAMITATSGEFSASAQVTVTPAPIIQLARDSVPFAAIGGGPDPGPDSVAITNAGGSVLDGLAVDTIRYSVGAAAWLTASLDNVTAPATLTLTATSTGIALGTHSAVVVLTAPTATNSPDSVIVTLTVSAGAATQIAANGGDGQTATVGSAVATPPSVIVQDQYGNPVAGESVTFAIGSGGGSVTGGSATTGANGVATVGSWALGTAAGANSLTATSGSLTGSPVTFTATGTPGAATQAIVSAGDGQTAAAGSAVSIAPAVQVLDQFGNPVAGVAVTFAVGSGGGSVTAPAQTSDAGGIATVGSWTLGTTAGPNGLNATVTGVAVPVALTATAIAGAAAQVAATAGDGQSAPVGSAVTTAPTVRVADQFGNPVAGFVVSFAVGSGGGNVTGATPTTDAAGLASVGSWTLGNTAGGNTLSASAPGLTGSPVTFSATATAGAATQMAVNAGNGQSATVNTAVATLPSVLVRDQFNNPVAGVIVTFAVTGGGGILTSGATSTNGSGVATVGSWTLGTGAGGNSLSATSTGLAGSPITFTATGTADAATQIAVSAGAGQTATVNTTVATAPTVVVRDQFSNPVAGVAVTFAVTAGGGSRTGGAATTNASGVATVGSWTLGTAAGTNNNSLTATSGALTGSPVTFTASATAGAATQIALNGGDAQSAAVNTPVPIAPSVLVRDQFNNPKAGVGVTFAVTGGGGNVAGGSATTNASGIAQVMSWTLGPSTGANTLTATAAGLAGSPVTFNATAFAGSASIIALNGGNAQTDTAGAPLAIAYTVLVTDGLGNPVQGIAVGWAVTGGGGSILPATSNTNASGIASASRTLGTTAGTNTATASVGGLSGSPVTFTATATAATATQIALNAGNGQSATVNTAVTVDPSVIVRDQFNNPKSGVGVTFAASGNGSVTGGSATTNASGIATVGSWTLDTVAGANTLTATSAGLSGSPVNFSATGAAGAATQIALSAGNNQSATVNTNVATAPAVLVRDQYNNPKSGVSVTFAVQAGGGSVTGGAATTNGSGIATVGSWRVGTAAGANNNTLHATSAGLAGSPVAFTASAAHDVATQIAVNAGNNQSAAVSTTVPIAPSVVVADQFGNAVDGISVTFAVTGGGGSVNPITAITTNASGIAQVTSWTLGASAGANSLSATSSPALTGSPVTINATGFAGSATQMALNAGDGQTDTVGATLATAYSVIVRDGSNNPVQGVPVSWAVGVGGGSITPSSNTDVNGIASATRILGTSAGSQTATAAVGGLTGSPVTFTATATAGAATQIAVNAGNGQSATVNTTVGTAPSVVVRDQFGNPKAGVGVTFAVSLGGGGLTGGAQSTNASGVATVGSWTLGSAAGANSLTATSAGLTGSPVTFTATGTADAATQIALNVGNNQTAAVNTAVATAPAVLVRDQFNNPVASVSVTFAVGLGGGNVTGGSASTNASGIATVGSWTLGTGAGTNNNTLTATSGSLIGSPVTFTASATPGGATQIALNAGDGQTATVNTAVATDPSVAVTDQFGNPVAGVIVTFAVQNGGGNVTGAIDTTDASGIASVGAWTLGTLAGTSNNSLTAGSGSLSGSPVTFTASATADAATQIAVNNGDGQTATVNTAVATAPSVLVRDQFNNPVASVSVTFAVGLGGGGVTGGSAMTNASGIATVGSWTLGTTAGTSNNTLTATSGGLSGSPVTFTASADAGTPTTLAISAGNGQNGTVNANVAVAPAVLVTDVFANPVPGASVTFAVTLGGGSVSGSPASTDASGIATVTSWTLGTAAGANTLHATLAALTPVDFTATGTAGAATTIAVNGGNAQSATVNTAVAVAPSAIVTDQFGNPVAGVGVTFAVTSGGGTVDPVTQLITGSNGIAQVTSWTLGTTAGANTLSATSSPVLTGSPVAFTATGTAGAATQMALNAGNGQSATVNTAVLVDPSVLVRDAFNNPVQGVTITFTVSPGSGFTSPASPAAVLSDVNGLATITGWFVGTASGTDTLTATAALSGSPVVFTATATPGAVNAAQSTVVDGAVTITACSAACTVLGGTADSITVTARDGFGNTISGASVVISSTGTNNTFSPSASGSTNASGVFAAKLNSTTAQAKTISAAINTVGITQTAAVTVAAAAGNVTNSTVATSDAAIVACSASCSTGGNTASTITVTVRDVFNNVVPSVTVTPSCLVGSTCTFAPASGSTNASGVFTTTFNSTVAQAKTIRAVIAAGQVTQTAAVTVSAAAAANVTINAGNSQTAAVALNVATDPSVVVTDAFGNAVSGQTVTFLIVEGGGSVLGGSPVTNASGVATVTSWTMGGTGTEGAEASGIFAGQFENRLKGRIIGVDSVEFLAHSFYRFATDVSPIIGAPCTGCHYLAWTYANIVGQNQQDGAGYASCTIANSVDQLIDASNASLSLIYVKTSAAPCGSTMPAAAGLTAAQRTILRAWINDGALNN